MRILALVAALFAFQTTPVFAQDLVVAPGQLQKSLKLIRQIYSKAISRKILVQAFKGQLAEGQKELTETQLLLFLNENEVVEATIQEYLAEVDAVEAKQIERLEGLVKKLETKLEVTVDKDLLSRLIVRELRSNTPVAAISKFLKDKGASDDQIKEVVTQLKELEKVLAQDLDPILKKYTGLFKDYLKDPEVQVRFKKYADPNARLKIKMNDGTKGYETVETYVNHPTQDVKGKWIPENDIENDGYIHAVNLAKYEYAAAVFEVDLPGYAHALADRKDLLERIQAIDKKNYDARQEVRDAIDIMNQGGVKTSLVVTNNLYHQKMAAIDYNHPGNGYVFASTANGTQSCSGKLGDLLNLEPHPPQSRPNSNMAALFKSDIMAAFFAHDIFKSSMDSLKGAEIPPGGIVEIEGEGKLSFAFTPNGANNDMIGNMYVAMIDALDDPNLGGVLFVESGGRMADAIIRWGLRMYAKGLVPHPQFTFHKGFAMQAWADPLRVIGLKLIGSKEEKNLQYVEDPESEIVKKLTPEQLAKWRDGFRIASKMFQDGSVEVDGVKYEYTVKTHNKLVAAGNLSKPKKLKVNMSSFNPSDNAESNHEFVIQAEGDLKMSDVGRRVITYHFAKSQSSVYAEAVRRNQRNEFDDPLDKNVDDPKNRNAAKRAAPTGKQAAAYDLQAKHAKICNEKMAIQAAPGTPALPKNN